MKKTFLSMALIAVAILIGLSACNKDGDNPWNHDDQMMVSSQTLPDAFIPYFDANEVTVEGDLNSDDIDFYPEFSGRDGRDDRHGDKRDKMRKWREKMKQRHGQGFELRVLLRKLRLNERQREQFHKILVSYRDCVKDIMQNTMDERKEIMDKAREARMEIIKDFRAGNIDRQEAIKQLRTLYSRVREAMNNLIDKEALCNCYKRMLTNLYDILTPEQKRIFMTWLKNTKNPCLKDWKINE